MAQGRKTGGRVAGTRNKRSAEVETFARDLLGSVEYREGVKQRLLAGELAPPLEILLYHYAYGKPVDRLENAGDGPLTIQVLYGSASEASIV